MYSLLRLKALVNAGQDLSEADLLLTTCMLCFSAIIGTTNSGNAFIISLTSCLNFFLFLGPTIISSLAISAFSYGNNIIRTYSFNAFGITSFFIIMCMDGLTLLGGMYNLEKMITTAIGLIIMLINKKWDILSCNNSWNTIRCCDLHRFETINATLQQVHSCASPMEEYFVHFNMQLMYNEPSAEGEANANDAIQISLVVRLVLILLVVVMCQVQLRSALRALTFAIGIPSLFIFLLHFLHLCMIPLTASRLCKAFFSTPLSNLEVYLSIRFPNRFCPNHVLISGVQLAILHSSIRQRHYCSPRSLLGRIFRCCFVSGVVLIAFKFIFVVSRQSTIDFLNKIRAIQTNNSNIYFSNQTVMASHLLDNDRDWLYYEIYEYIEAIFEVQKRVSFSVIRIASIEMASQLYPILAFTTFVYFRLVVMKSAIEKVIIAVIPQVTVTNSYSIWSVITKLGYPFCLLGILFASHPDWSSYFFIPNEAFGLAFNEFYLVSILIAIYTCLISNNGWQILSVWSKCGTSASYILPMHSMKVLTFISIISLHRLLSKEVVFESSDRITIAQNDSNTLFERIHLAFNYKMYGRPVGIPALRKFNHGGDRRHWKLLDHFHIFFIFVTSLLLIYALSFNNRRCNLLGRISRKLNLRFKAGSFMLLCKFCFQYYEQLILGK